MKLGLENRRALVLGASKGLGAAIAVALANEGVEVHGAARSVDAVAALNGQVDPQNGGPIQPHHLD
ncbi:MAG: family oxidoreductase, partial [Devosia sp.]|nr:family oxidoreductase [Devosia sp.]